ncbi:MAG: M20/M25/M40 family metallo-hydrolase, partial [Candidatus Thorarchaeota archaeon]
ASLEFKTKHAGWGSDQENKFIKLFHSAVKETVSSEIPIAADLGGNDGFYFIEHGIPTACYGTIDDNANFHGIDEWLLLEDFDKVKKALIRFAEIADI